MDDTRLLIGKREKEREIDCRQKETESLPRDGGFGSSLGRECMGGSLKT